MRLTSRAEAICEFFVIESETLKDRGMVQAFQTTVPVRDKIKEMVRRIVERFNPEKIVLFGSHAREDAGPDSDADILVIMPVKDSRRKKATEIDVALIGVNLPRKLALLRRTWIHRFMRGQNAGRRTASKNNRQP